jgi:hypothetical protein
MVEAVVALLDQILANCDVPVVVRFNRIRPASPIGMNTFRPPTDACPPPRASCVRGADRAAVAKRLRLGLVGCGQHAAAVSPNRVVRQRPSQRHIAPPSPCEQVRAGIAPCSVTGRR